MVSVLLQKISIVKRKIIYFDGVVFVISMIFI